MVSPTPVGMDVVVLELTGIGAAAALAASADEGASAAISIEDKPSYRRRDVTGFARGVRLLGALPRRRGLAEPPSFQLLK